MAKRRSQKNVYVAVGADGKMFSITAPNAKTARIVALNNETPVISCQRVFKRGGTLGGQAMKKGDVFVNWA